MTSFPSSLIYGQSQVSIKISFGSKKLIKVDILKRGNNSPAKILSHSNFENWEQLLGTKPINYATPTDMKK